MSQQVNCGRMQKQFLLAGSCLPDASVCDYCSQLTQRLKVSIFQEIFGTGSYVWALTVGRLFCQNFHS